MTAAATPHPTPTLVPPARTPDSRRKFQLTEFGENHNKWWQIEVWNLGAATLHLRTTWGRVGAAPQSKDKICTEVEVRRVIQEKQAKGYQELDLHAPPVVTTTAAAPAAPPQPRKVVELLDMIFAEAGQRIASYLAVTVDALSQAQIQRGRDLLEQTTRQHQVWRRSQARADFATLVESVKAYYNAIPTQLPRNLRDTQVMEGVVLSFCQDLGEQETRLNQLEAALATYKASTPGGATSSPYDLLGARIGLLPEKDRIYGQIVDFLGKTSRHGYAIRVRDVFEIEVPSERAAFERNTFGSHRVLRLTHGTNNANVRHILHEHGAGSGLRLPRSYTNGWMFGPGIYFANVASKSAQYCRSRSGYPNMMFLADVALGEMYMAPTDMSGTRAAPQGYHSVWGKAHHTKSWGGALAYDEFIVYRQEQQSLRYLITWEPR
jgi:poly [ADP-ribose] polymerase